MLDAMLYFGNTTENKMKSIYTVEVFDPTTNSTIFKSPFDIFPVNEFQIKTIEDLQKQIDLIEDRIKRECCKSRLWFIEWRNQNYIIRIGKMNWKWDEEYYKNLVPNHSKGADSSDDEMFKN